MLIFTVIAILSIVLLISVTIQSPVEWKRVLELMSEPGTAAGNTAFSFLDLVKSAVRIVYCCMI